MSIPTIKYVRNSVKIIDQRKLPRELKFIVCRDVKTLWKAIKVLAVRGAPALGVAAAFGVLLSLRKFRGQMTEDRGQRSGVKCQVSSVKERKAFDRHIHGVCDYIGSSRPTAVNLFNALEQMKRVLENYPSLSVEQVKKLLQKEAFSIYEEDRRVCRQMGKHGATLIKNNSRLLTACNAGALATVDYGTALGVMYSAKAQGKKFKVYACETRPLLQGARLTTWELLQHKIDTTLICDNMAATLMKQGKIDAVMTGADRVAANGDAANKIGTYGLAVLAKHHKIPFYIVAPLSTFDFKMKSGKQIPIELRDPQEVTHFAGAQIAPKGIKAYNPAFDVTPAELITAIVTEHGIIRPPFAKNIRKIFLKYVPC